MVVANNIHHGSHVLESRNHTHNGVWNQQLKQYQKTAPWDAPDSVLQELPVNVFIIPTACSENA